MSAAIRLEEPDHVPLWCLWSHARDPYNRKDDRKRIEGTLELGLDDTLWLYGPWRIHPDVKVTAWTESVPNEEYDLLHKRFETPAGTLEHVLRSSEHFTDADEIPVMGDLNMSHGLASLIRGREDLPALRYLLSDPDPKQLADYREQAEVYRRFAQDKQVLLEGAFVALGDAAAWLVQPQDLIYACHDDPGFVDELLDIIEDKRAWLRDHPSSCSARHGREAAFEELYNLLQSRFGMAREQVDAEYRNYEDYVFADLSYNESKTCCWNSTSRAMYDVVMSYNLSRQEEAQACLAPTVFKAQNGGYQTFSDHAQSIGQGAAWVPWSADETCPQANVANDLESTHGWTPFCEVSDAILNRGEEGSETSGETAGTDPFEPNDSRGTAHLLAEGSFEGARIAENDSDWFTFEPPTDSIVRFSIAFEHGDGDLDLRMYRGEQVADRSTSTHDEESVDLSFDGNEPISVQVYGYEGATGDYRITVSFDGGVATGDPCNDSNETQETAFEIGEGTYNGLRICEGDIDWFRIPATTSQGAITVEFNPGTGDLDIALYKSNGTLIDSSTTTSGVETVESGPGLRFLKVYGYNGATGDYTLRINE